MTKLTFGATLGAALLLAAPAARSGDSLERRAAADPAGQVEVSNVSGSVTVSGWERSEVQLAGELGESGERLEFSSDDKFTRIKILPSTTSSRSSGSDLVIHVPKGSSLIVVTTSADIAVSGVLGAQRLKSVSGDVKTGAGREDVECRTVSGDVVVTGAGPAGLLTINTVSGDARVSAYTGEINANTVSGNFDLDMAAATRSRLRSTSGDLDMTATLPGDARLDAESISGNVTLTLRGPINSDFDVSSFNGDISNCFGPKAQRTDEYAPGRDLRFREGSGSGRVRVKTLNGDIKLCRK